MDYPKVGEHISNWLKDYAVANKCSGFVVGISGGIDSAVTSTLCAKTGLEVLVLEMPIYQASSQVSRAKEHITWLQKIYPKVSSAEIELTHVFDALIKVLPAPTDQKRKELALANTRARLRMTTLYYFAGIRALLVAGTGNKVEDFGVGFFTKYGDGGVDISPIADINKTEVFGLAAHLGIVESIQLAEPTDGLWGDDRTDEDQIGASYPELEWAMEFVANGLHNKEEHVLNLSDRKKEVLAIYLRMNKANTHKMIPIPVCLIPEHLK